MRYLVWVKPEFMYVVMSPLFHPFSSYYLPKCKLNSAKTLSEVLTRRSSQIERGLQWFKMPIQLPDNSTTNPF